MMGDAATPAAGAGGAPPAGAAAGQDVKTDVKKEQINVRVVGQDQNEVHFKIKRTTQLKKLMEAYCERQGKQPQTVRFTYEGERINETQTPADLQMEDNDQIEVFVQQVGGC